MGNGSLPHLLVETSQNGMAVPTPGSSSYLVHTDLLQALALAPKAVNFATTSAKPGS